MTDSTGAVWAPETDATRREHRRASIVAWTLGAFLFAAAAVYLYAGLLLADYWLMLVVAFGLLAVISVFLYAFGIYRRVPPAEAREVLAGTIFHASAADWEPGEEITLAVARCVKRQYLAGAGNRLRRWKVVYFFPQRPTEAQTRGQILAGKKHARRHLYEMTIIDAPAALYRRESAIAVPQDIRARVVARQEIPARGRARA